MTADRSTMLGSVIAGRFKLRRVIGSGGMGDVFAAVGRKGERVAIKLMHERAARDPDLVVRFQREAAIASQIRSPFVAGIVDAGSEPDGRLWIAFELLRGESLDHRLKRDHCVAFAEACWMVDDILEGLHAAHSAGVIHRDIKPGNLFLERVLEEAQVPPGSRGQRVRILDFGVSKLRRNDAEQSALTALDATLGSFSYMAPEQVRGSATVDERADLYALGVVIFRMMLGRLPFQAPLPAAVLALKLDRDPPSLSEASGETWPPILEQYLQVLMARDREARFRTSADALLGWRTVCNALDAGVTLPSLHPDDVLDDDRTEVMAATYPTMESFDND